VAVNRGTFNGGGQLSWSQPAFINQTTSPSTLNDKEWIAADWHGSSPFKDNVYVTWTRYIFNPSIEGLKMYRVHVTYTLSLNGLEPCQSAAIHSLSFRVEGLVVWLMKAGWLQLSWPPPLNVPRLTATVFGALARL